MPVDVFLKDNVYTIKAEVPGVLKENVYVTFNDDDLSMAIGYNEEKNEEERTEDGMVVRKERTVKSAYRVIYLKNEVKEETIKANVKDGI